jgi:hypothetical protein
VTFHDVAEAPAEDAEGSGLVPEAAGCLGGGEALDEIGAERFVLALARVVGFGEEPRLWR